MWPWKKFPSCLWWHIWWDSRGKRRARCPYHRRLSCQQVIAQILREQIQRNNDNEWESAVGLNDGNNENLERARKNPGRTVEKAVTVAGRSPGVQQFPSYIRDTSPAPRKKSSRRNNRDNRDNRGRKQCKRRRKNKLWWSKVKKQSLPPTRLRLFPKMLSLYIRQREHWR